MKRWAACLKNQSVVISLQFPDEASHQKDLILDGYKSQGWSKLLWNPKLTILSGDEWRIVLLLWEIFFAPIIWDSFDRIIPLEKAGQGGQMIEDLSTKDEVSDLGYRDPHTCKKRVMLRRWLFWPKKFAEKVRKSRQNVNRDKSA